MNNKSLNTEELKATNLFNESWYRNTYSIPAHIDAYQDFLDQNDLMYKSPNMCFDAKWYISNYHTEFDWNQIHPLIFYISEGWKLGHDPSPNFSTQDYLETHEDLKNLDSNPLEHYLKYGQSEGRLINKVNLNSLLSFENYLKNEQALVKTGLFLKLWYMNCNQDINFQNINPIQHFILNGIREGRKPNPYFDPKWYAITYKSTSTTTIKTIIDYSEYEWEHNNPSPHFLNKAYLENNLDAKENNYEPLYHYLQFGVDEKGRSIYSYHNNQQIEAFLSPIASSNSNVPLVSKESYDIHIVWEDTTIFLQAQKNFLKTIQYAEMSGHNITLWYLPSFYNGNQDFITQQLYTQYGVSFQKIRTDFSYSKICELNGDLLICNSFIIAQSLLNQHSLNGFSQKYFFLDNYAEENHTKAILRHFNSALGYITSKSASFDHIVSNLDLEAIYLRPLAHEDLFAQTTSNHSSTLETIKNNESVKHKIIYFYFEENNYVSETNSALEALRNLGYDFELELMQLGQLIDFDTQTKLENTLNTLKSVTLGLIVNTNAISSESLTLMNLNIPTIVVSNNLEKLDDKSIPLTFVLPKARNIATALQDLLDKKSIQGNHAINKPHLSSLFSLKNNYLHFFQQITGLSYTDTQKTSQQLPIVKQNTSEKQIDVSIVIPTYNGGESLKSVIKAVQSQAYPQGFEIIIIDSESTDDTPAYFADIEDVRFHKIAKQDFNHGGTRNLGVRLAKGNYVAFITQDAIPANNLWLYNLVTPLKTNTNAAGVFGRHIPYTDTSKYLKRDLNNHFAQFNQYPLTVSKTTKLPQNLQNNPDSWNHILWFYSDNNSCLRKSIWETIPLPEVSFGEDQLWAQRIIAAGYEKCYAPNAVVIHSHNYDYNEVYGRSKIESEFHYKYFGFEHIRDEKELITTLEIINENDKQWGKQNNYSLNEISTRIALNEAQLRGYLDGKHNNSIFEKEQD